MPHDDAGTANDREPLEMTEFMRAMVLRMGRWRGDDRVNVGRVFKHMLLESTRHDIAAAVGAVPQARRTMVVARDSEALVKMERRLLKRYASLMVPAPGRKLFLEGPANCDYYDEKALEADPKVRALLDDLTRKFQPGGLRMRMAGAARASLMVWRRLANRFR